MKTLFTCLALVVGSLFASEASAFITRGERAVIRHDVREVRSDLRHAGGFWNPAERAVIRHDVRDLRGDVRRAIRW